MASNIKLVGSVPDWSSPGGLKDGAYILSPFEIRFVGLNSSMCQGPLSSQGFLAKFDDFTKAKINYLFQVIWAYMCKKAKILLYYIYSFVLSYSSWGFKLSKLQLLFIRNGLL